MSEIERAMKMLERQKELAGKTRKSDDNAMTSGIITEIENCYEIAITLCRAELEREKNPLTCDGCGYVGYSICEDCIRNKKIKKDYYKEKMCDRYFEEDGGQCWSCCCWNEDKKDYKIFVTCKGDKTKCCR